MSYVISHISYIIRIRHNCKIAKTTTRRSSFTSLLLASIRLHGSHQQRTYSVQLYHVVLDLPVVVARLDHILPRMDLINSKRVSFHTYPVLSTIVPWVHCDFFRIDLSHVCATIAWRHVMTKFLDTDVLHEPGWRHVLAKFLDTDVLHELSCVFSPRARCMSEIDPAERSYLKTITNYLYLSVTIVLTYTEYELTWRGRI